MSRYSTADEIGRAVLDTFAIDWHDVTGFDLTVNVGEPPTIAVRRYIFSSDVRHLTPITNRYVVTDEVRTWRMGDTAVLSHTYPIAAHRGHRVIVGDAAPAPYDYTVARFGAPSTTYVYAHELAEARP